MNYGYMEQYDSSSSTAQKGWNFLFSGIQLNFNLTRISRLDQILL